MTKVLLIGCFDDSGSNDKYKLIKQLLIEAQEQENLSVKRNLILLRIVNIVLLMRPICRKFNGQPLNIVYQELYDLIKRKI